MLSDRRPLITNPEILDALAHPVRLDVLTYLMSAGPATATACAQAVSDSPSNCSYHLRTLAGHGLVEPADPAAGDRRQRPWRATITGFDINPEADPATPEGRATAALLSASVALDQRRLHDYLVARDSVPAKWRQVDGAAEYTLRVTPEELQAVLEGIDGLLRPLIAAGRPGAPDDAELVHCNVVAFPRLGEPWRREHPGRGPRQ